MADGTHIEWTDATVNAINGCVRVSPGCGGPGPHGGCYAERLAGTRLRDHPSRAGLTRQTSAGPRWTGAVRLNEAALMQPLGWRKARRIFWNAHGDTFHGPTEWIDRCMAVMALTPHHQHQVLTKRAAQMRAYFADPRTPGRIARVIMDWMVEGRLTQALRHCDHWPVRSIGDIDHPDDIVVDLPLRSVWLGVSVEDQKRAEERIPDLLATPAVVRWLSVEPLLGPVDLTAIDLAFVEAREPERSGLASLDALTGVHADGNGEVPGVLGSPDPHVDWVVVGGESGPNARPMHPGWARALRDQCAAVGVPFFFKQWGEWGHAKMAPSGTPGRYALASGGDVLSRFWPATVGEVDAYPRMINLFGGGQVLERVGKKAAGRLLDGVLHDGMPS